MACERLAFVAFSAMLVVRLSCPIAFQVALMTIASGLRATLLAAAIAALLPVSPNPLSAQEQISTPSTTRIIGAPVGHRQPRPTDIPPTDKSAADQLEEKLQAELNRKLRICRGC
jgi:hypothetical protein